MPTTCNLQREEKTNPYIVHILVDVRCAYAFVRRVCVCVCFACVVRGKKVEGSGGAEACDSILNGRLVAARVRAPGRNTEIGLHHAFICM